MKYILRKIAAFLHFLGNFLDGGEPQIKELTTKEIIEAPTMELLPAVKIEPQREVPDNKRKLLLLLAKDELTDSEQAEMNELTAGKEIIILEDT
jgi:hypothetical protein